MMKAKTKSQRKYRKYEEDELTSCLNGVRCKKMSVRKASKLFGVPRSTIMRYLTEQGNTLKLYGGKFLLDEDEEKSLANYMRWCEDRLVPFSYSMLESFASDILRLKCAESHTVSHKWCQSFVKRHNFSQRKARHVEPGRMAAAACSSNVIDYFNLLSKEVERLGLKDSPDCVWNTDEKGWSKQQSLQQPVLATRGKLQAKVKPIFINDHITTVHCVNAAGSVIPPYVIFSKNIPSQMDVDAIPHDWAYGSSESGYVNSELFVKWFSDVFLPHIGRKRPQLLVYDAASSHFSVDLIQLAIKHNIAIISLPAKTTAFLQPVDQILSVLHQKFSFIAYSLSMSKFDFLVRPNNFPPVLSQALTTAWTPSVVKQAFRITGLFPPSLEQVKCSEHLTDKCKQEIQSYLDAPSEATTSSTLLDINADAPAVVEPAVVTEDDNNSIDVCIDCGREIVDCSRCVLREKKKSNPLLKDGLISQRLAKILDPPAIPIPKSRSSLSKAKRVTGEDLLKDLERRKQLQAEKEERALLRKKKKEAKNASKATTQAGSKSTKKPPTKASSAQAVHLDLPDIQPPKRKPKKRPNMVSGTRSSDRVVRRLDYSRLNRGGDATGTDICPECKLQASPEEDEVLNIIWYGCDYCPRWWHRHCLSGSIQTNADLSIMDSTTKFRCPACPEQAVCCTCLGSLSNIVAAQCYICLAQYHVNCMPAQTQINYSVLVELGQNWYCGKCSEE